MNDFVCIYCNQTTPERLMSWVKQDVCVFCDNDDSYYEEEFIEEEYLND
jgi:hypothetical protein